MKNYFPSIIFVLLVCLTSCEKTNDFDDKTNIQGYWMIEHHSPEEAEYLMDSILVFNRVDKLDFYGYGFALLDEGYFIERKNSGWCATPQILYGNFVGEWIVDPDEINLISDYWATNLQGERIHQQWELMTISKDQLSIKRINLEVK